MKYRKLGTTDLTVSEVGLGLWTLGSEEWGAPQEPVSLNILSAAIGNGMNFFDAADIYGNGYSETLLGRALQKRRHNAVIATKAGWDMYSLLPLVGPDERPQNFTPQYIRQACEQSLGRLRTDYIDLFQLHYPTLRVIAQDDVFHELGRLVRDGMIRHWGVVAGNSPEGAESAIAAIEEQKAKAVQLPFSIVDQRGGRQVFPKAEKAGTGVVLRAALAGGLLTRSGQIRSESGPEWLRITPTVPASAVKMRSALAFLPKEIGASLAQSAIKYALSMPGVVSVLPDIMTLEQVEEFAAVSEKPEIPPEYMDRIEDIRLG